MPGERAICKGLVLCGSTYTKYLQGAKSQIHKTVWRLQRALHGKKQGTII